MAKGDQKGAARRKTALESLPFDKTNYRILGAAIVTIVLGYVALSQPPWDGFWPLDVAPILLVLGYCVLVPLGLLYHRKEAPATAPAAAQPPAATPIKK